MLLRWFCYKHCTLGIDVYSLAKLRICTNTAKLRICTNTNSVSWADGPHCKCKDKCASTHAYSHSNPDRNVSAWFQRCFLVSLKTPSASQHGWVHQLMMDAPRPKNSPYLEMRSEDDTELKAGLQHQLRNLQVTDGDGTNTILTNFSRCDVSSSRAIFCTSMLQGITHSQISEQLP